MDDQLVVKRPDYKQVDSADELGMGLLFRWYLPE